MESDFNIIAVIVASVAAMFLGGLWYSPLLFEKRWRNLVAIAEDKPPPNPAIVYGGAYLLMLLSAAVFHTFLGPEPELAFAVGVGVAAGVAWAAGSLWISYLFESRPAGLFWINGGYHIAQYTVYGLVFGLI